ncbi:MAG TPA: OsmC family protein [Bdellovibrionota bacterium]|nr:OsmC family protein [Bdellovibrionota bacterium]
MKLECTWNDRMHFTVEAGRHRVEMDTQPPQGTDGAPSPKQLLLSAICGCTGMDVVALLKKYKEAPESFRIDADATPTEGVYPVVFKDISLTFRLRGPLDPEKVLEAVRLSQTKYCGVTAMVSKSVPVSYSVELNGKTIGTGHADFK